VTWATETDFVNSFVNLMYFEKNQKKYYYKIWREVNTGFGKPDVVVIEYKPEILESRINFIHSKMPPLSTKAAYAMSYLSSRRWVSTEKLGNFLLCSRSQLRSVVEELTDRGLVKTKRHLIKANPKSEILAVNRLWVFEAKLFQWKTAIEQAERHLWFTKDSYVLMPSEKKSLIDLISLECEKRGIGLSFFNEQSGLETVVHSAETGLKNSPILWMINEKLLEECK
jgi:biotin operon repressor